MIKCNLHHYESAAEREQDASDRAAAAKLATAAATEVRTIHQSIHSHTHPSVHQLARASDVTLDRMRVTFPLVRLLA